MCAERAQDNRMIEHISNKKKLFLASNSLSFLPIYFWDKMNPQAGSSQSICSVESGGGNCKEITRVDSAGVKLPVWVKLCKIISLLSQGTCFKRRTNKYVPEVTNISRILLAFVWDVTYIQHPRQSGPLGSHSEPWPSRWSPPA